ncbi:MAG TPA: CoA transferase [Dehalococcoidia bacterium]|nr:CoA transferase [Dehalococcoidia bacterium]
MPALEGMRVLDMTQYEAGTSCTQLLAWLGADVVKLEPPGRGDPGRGVGPHGSDVPSQYFLNYNSNKRSVVIDLAKEEGRDLLLDMAPHYDVFVENYGPGVIERLGLTYDEMRQRNPSIIYGRIKGFGLQGPYADYKCYDWVAQAAAGAFSVTGDRDGPPTMPGPTIADSGAGVQMALAITAAYVQKLRTGEGQFIEVSMQEAVTLFMRTLGLAEWGKAAAPRDGSRRGPPTDVYPCKPGGPNDYLFIMTVTTRMWDTLCAAIDRTDLLTDPRFENPWARVQHGDDLHAEISKWTRERTKFEAMHELARAGVPCSAVLDTYDVFVDPHLQARAFIRTVPHPTAGDVLLMGSPLRMSGSEVSIQAAPLLGEHTNDVLHTDLGLTDAQIAELRRAGAVG